MTFRERLADLVRGRKVKNDTPISQITQGSELWSTFVDMIGKLPALTEHTALMQSPIYACVNLIAGAISALPVHIYHVNVPDGERDRVYTDDLNWVFNEQMSPRWSAANGWEYLVQSLLLHGDAFARILRDLFGAPIGLIPIHPFRVTVVCNKDGSRLVYGVAPEYANGQTIGRFEVYDQDDILHVAGFGFDGLRGLSPLRNALRLAGSGANAMQEFSNNFFANSARPDYALVTAQALGQDRVDELKQQIDENHKAAANAHRPMLLHSGLDLKSLTMPLEDTQLLMSRQFGIEEIARIYGVPPFMIGHNEKTTSWGSGVEAMAIGFVRFTLRQHLNKFQNEINRKFFRKASRIAEFDTADLERADTKSLYESLRILVGRAGETRMATVNEARAVLRLKKDTEADSNALGVNPGQASPPASGNNNAQQAA